LSEFHIKFPKGINFNYLRKAPKSKEKCL
jgi:hypothetical protein